MQGNRYRVGWVEGNRPLNLPHILFAAIRTYRQRCLLYHRFVLIYDGRPPPFYRSLDSYPRRSLFPSSFYHSFPACPGSVTAPQKRNLIFLLSEDFLFIFDTLFINFLSFSSSPPLSSLFQFVVKYLIFPRSFSSITFSRSVSFFQTSRLSVSSPLFLIPILLLPINLLAFHLSPASPSPTLLSPSRALVP